MSHSGYSSYASSKLKSALRSFLPVFEINEVGDVRALLDGVLRSDADIAANVRYVSWKTRVSPAHTSMSITYFAKTHYAVSVVYTASQLEDELHACCRELVEKKVLLVRDTLDGNKIISDYVDVFGSFYPGVKNFSRTWTKGLPIKGFYRLELNIIYRASVAELSYLDICVKRELAKLKRKLFLPDMPPVVKAYVAHNYLAKEVRYSEAREDDPMSKIYVQCAYGALVRKRCVCQGYAEAYKLLLNDQGVPCEVVTGVVKGSTGRHAWNMISTDGKNFYHVDVTWDSLDDGGKRDKYFALRDDELKSLRTWNKKRWLKSGCDDLLAQARAIVTAERRSYAARGVPLKYLD